jgi:ABC-type polysaccharide/polyol phosphate export permease
VKYEIKPGKNHGNQKKHEKAQEKLKSSLHNGVAQRKKRFTEILFSAFCGTVLNPLLSMFVLSFVYSQVFGAQMENIKYPVYVLSGMIIYNTFFRTGSTMGLSSIVDQRYLVLQTQIPITAYPRVAVYTAVINFLFSFIALLIVMVMYGQPFKWTLVLLVVLIAALLLLTMGVSYILATVYVYFRDIRNIYGVLVTLLMYMTPLFYTMESLHNQLVVDLLKYNPMYYYVDYFRLIIMGVVPSWEYHLLIFGMGFFLYAFGYVFLVQSKKRFIFHL